MYNDLFKLEQPPFRLTPDPEFLFASKQHARAKAYMESTIWLADGFVVITGEIGAGKTTLIESFLADLPEDVVLAHVSQTQLSPIEFLQAVLRTFHCLEPVTFGFKKQLHGIPDPFIVLDHEYRPVRKSSHRFSHANAR